MIVAFLPHARRAFAILAFAVLWSAGLHAQTGTGTVIGRVSDLATGRSLQGAIVSVIGTGGRDYTDADGRYAISVPPGSYSVEIDYVGLDLFRETVLVTAGSTTTLNAPLKSQVLALETFEVRESARGQALAINQQRTAAGIVNIVSEETFGEMMDGNIGQALAYLPSITMDESQDGSVGGINIRGVENEYNAFLVDGQRIATRGFDTRNISGDGIATIEVIKAPTPDRDGDAIGGMVNVVTRTAFQRDGRSISLKANATLNDLPEKWGHGASFSFSDLYSVGAGEKNLGISFALSHYKTNRYSINADIDWEQITPETNPASWNIQGQMDAIGGHPIWFMEATHWEWNTRVTNNHGLSGSIDFRTDEFNSFYIRPTYGYYARQGTTFETDIDIDTRFQNAAGGRKTYAFVTPVAGQGTPGNAGSRGRIQWIGTDDHRKNNLFSLAAGGRHERTDSLLTYDLVTSRNKQRILSDLEFQIGSQPNNPWILWEYELVAPWRGEILINQLTDYDFYDPSVITYGELVDETSVRTEDTFSARIDWEKKFPLGNRSVFAFKTGAKYRALKTAFDQTALLWETGSNFPYRQVVERTDEVLFLKEKYFDVYPRRARDLVATNPGLFEPLLEDILADSTLPNFDGRENVTAAYIMGTYQFGPHTFIGGVRWEGVKWRSLRNEGDFSFVSEIDEFGEEGARRVLDSIRRVRYGSSYSNFLPGVHGRHELRPNLILRESYNRSYGKPRLSDLTAGRFVNEDGDIEEGNPNLKPALSDNFDIQLEYYTPQGGLYSIGAFHKKIKDFSYVHAYNFDQVDANGVPIEAPGGEFTYEAPRNGTTAKNTGVELMARQRLHFLPWHLQNLSVDLSATFLETDAHYPNRTDRDDLSLPGFSDRVYTARLGYAQGGFSGRISYRFRSDFVEGLGTSVANDEFFAAEERVEAEISYRFHNGVRVYASGTNLSNRPQVSYQGYTAFTEDSSFPGRKFTFGVEYTF